MERKDLAFRCMLVTTGLMIGFAIYLAGQTAQSNTALQKYQEAFATTIDTRNDAILRAEIAETQLANRRYLVSYVYHTIENGPVAGYGFMFIGEVPDANTLWHNAIANEKSARKGKRQERIRSLSFLSINKL